MISTQQPHTDANMSQKITDSDETITPLGENVAIQYSANKDQTQDLNCDNSLQKEGSDPLKQDGQIIK